MSTHRRTIIPRQALSARRWQPESLFASAAVASAEEARQHRRSASDVPDAVEPALLTPVRAARALRVGRTTVYSLVKERQLTLLHVKTSARLARTEIDEEIATRLDEARRQT